MTEIAMAVSAKRMGRPPLKAEVRTVKTTVRMTEDLARRIEEVAGPNKMAIFIREAVEAELERRERRPD